MPHVPTIKCESYESICDWVVDNKSSIHAEMIKINLFFLQITEKSKAQES